MVILQAGEGNQRGGAYEHKVIFFWTFSTPSVYAAGSFLSVRMWMFSTSPIPSSKVTNELPP
jgi:hypothetical protein